NAASHKSKTIIITEEQNLDNSSGISFENAIFDRSLPYSILDILYKNEIQSVIIEGGRKTLQTFIDQNLWDEARVFKGPVFFKKGIEAPSISGSLTEKKMILNDELLIFKP
ncbi:MAG TPA: dihydrofolate reductase family protein, partial [Flavobacterium sp.]|nr:dihydrofolate reductase family protein [Flavobacterium sp.]